MSDVKYHRILLKLSGEALAGESRWGIDNPTVRRIAGAIRDVRDMGVQIGIVVGGGNFWRGRSSEGMDRVTADHMGMLATSINALGLSDALEQLGVTTRVMSAIEMHQITETYIRKRALRHLEKGRVLVFSCGTGSPFFSTDTAAALRAAEIEADVVLKATTVDGVYDKDPKRYPDARRYERISHTELLQKQLAVMDSNAAAICRDNHLNILVFSLHEPENLPKVLTGDCPATLVY